MMTTGGSSGVASDIEFINASLTANPQPGQTEQVRQEIGMTTIHT